MPSSHPPKEELKLSSLDESMQSPLLNKGKSSAEIGEPKSSKIEKGKQTPHNNNNQLTAAGTQVPSRWKRTVSAVWSGEAVSFLTSGASGYALIWYITTTTGSATILALGVIMYFLPVAFLSPIAGPLVDRHNRKYIMIIADMGIAIATALIALVIMAGFTNIPLILACIAVRAVGQTFHQPAMQAVMPLLVPERHLVRIGSLSQGIVGATNIVSPALGILVYTTLGLHIALLLDVVGAIVACSILFVVKIPDVRLDASERTGFKSEFIDGLRAIRDCYGMTTFFTLVTLGCIAFMPMAALFPLMTAEHFGGNGYDASLIEAIWGIGFMFGAILLGIWGGGKRLVRLIAISVSICGILSIACGLLPSSGFKWFALFTGLMAIAGAFYNSPLVAVIQKNIAAEKLGRVMAVFGSLTSLASPIGLAFAGPVAEFTGVALMFVISGIGLLLVAFASLFFPYIHRLDSQTP